MASTSCLYDLCSHDDTEGVRSLIESLSPAELSDQISFVCSDGFMKGDTPLHMAARNGNVDIAKMLLDAGADKEAKTPDGRTPYNVATARFKTAVAALLKS